MSLYEHHIFICTNERAQGDPKGCCMTRGSKEVLEALKNEVQTRGLKGKVRANKSGCLDQCAQGPVVVIYPKATWYSKVQPSDAKEIVDAMLEGKTVPRLLHPRTR